MNDRKWRYLLVPIAVGHSGPDGIPTPKLASMRPFLSLALWMALQMPRTACHRKSASRGLISEKELRRALR